MARAERIQDLDHGNLNIQTVETEGNTVPYLFSRERRHQRGHHRPFGPYRGTGARTKGFDFSGQPHSFVSGREEVSRLHNLIKGLSTDSKK